MMSARWLVMLAVVILLAASSAVAKRLRAEARKGPPQYRGMFDSESAPAVVAAHGWNLLDVSSQASADQLPARTSGLVWVGDYDNSTCDWEVPDAALTAEIAAMAGDPKVAGYDISDEPDPAACPSPPAPSAEGARALQQEGDPPELPGPSLMRPAAHL